MVGEVNHPDADVEEGSQRARQMMQSELVRQILAIQRARQPPSSQVADVPPSTTVPLPNSGARPRGLSVRTFVAKLHPLLYLDLVLLIPSV